MMMGIVQKLANLGEHPGDNIVIAVLFSSVGEQYSNLIVSLDTAIKTQQNSLSIQSLSSLSVAETSPLPTLPTTSTSLGQQLLFLDVQWIIQCLMAEEAHQGCFRHTVVNNADNNSALYLKHTVQCHKCGKWGHYKSDCKLKGLLSSLEEFKEFRRWRKEKKERKLKKEPSEQEMVAALAKYTKWCKEEDPFRSGGEVSDSDDEQIPAHTSTAPVRHCF